MPRHPIDSSADVPRGTLFWTVISSLLVGQLAAFWMLCSNQVRKAEMRDTAAPIQRTTAPVPAQVPNNLLTVAQTSGKSAASEPMSKSARASLASR